MTNTFNPNMPPAPPAPFTNLPTQVLNVLQQQGFDINYLQTLPPPIPPHLMNSVLQQANIALPSPGQPPSPEATQALQNAGLVLPDFSKLPSPDQIASAFQQAGLPLPQEPLNHGEPGLFPAFPPLSPEAVTALQNAGFNMPNQSQIPTREVVDQLLNQAGFDMPSRGEMPRPEIVNQVLTQAGIPLPPPPTPGSAPQPFSPEAIAALQNAGITLPDMSKIPSQDQVKQVLANAGYNLPDPSQLPTPQQVNDVLTQAGIALPIPPAGMAPPHFHHFNTVNPTNDGLIAPNTINTSSIVPIATFPVNNINTMTGGTIDPLQSVVYDPSTVVYTGIEPTNSFTNISTNI
jgi:hypothetical protein